VAVPAEAALDAATAQRLVARDHVLHVAREQVPEVWKTVREGRAVVEHELVRAVHARRAVLDAALERALFAPTLGHALLDLGKRDLRGNFGIRRGRAAGVHEGAETTDITGALLP